MENENQQSVMEISEKENQEEKIIPTSNDQIQIQITETENNKIQLDYKEQILPKNKEKDYINPGKSKLNKEKRCRFPVGRIKNIMKMDDEIKLCQKSVYSIITKSVEFFIQELANNSFQISKKIPFSRDLIFFLATN